MEKQKIYGPFMRFVRWLARSTSAAYGCDFTPGAEPVVYVCRHLNMRGTLTLMKWLPMEVHPMSLSVFFTVKTAYNHYREYTFSRREGKAVRRFHLWAWISALFTVWTEKSMKAIPVYRDGQGLKTMRAAMEWLQKGHSVVVWPDVDYAKDYDTTPCRIYPGFLTLGEMYLKRTGRELPFVPLFIDDEKKLIRAREPVVVNDFKGEAEAAAQVLARRIDP